MNTLREAVKDYLGTRRNLGFKLHDAGTGLLDFVSFMEQHEVEYTTTPLALEWAQQSSSVQPAVWAQRLSHVRCFARYRSAFDPRTEIPPAGLLPHRPKRAHPYLYTEKEIRQLLEAALSLPTSDELRPRTYHCLLGLLAVTGLRISEAIGLKLEDVDRDGGFLSNSNLVIRMPTVLIPRKNVRTETLSLNASFFI